jgi:hypothetical protein
VVCLLLSAKLFPTRFSRQKPSFSVAAEVLLTVSNRAIISNTSPYLMAYPHGAETVLSPITDLIYIRLTNNRTAPLMIDYYSVEIRFTKEPQWKRPSV